MDLIPKEDWPQSVEEAVETLCRILNPEQQEAVRQAKGLIQFHHGLGTWIRNQFGLWRGNRKLLDDCAVAGDLEIAVGFIHPDSAAGIIVRALRTHLRNFPSRQRSAEEAG